MSALIHRDPLAGIVENRTNKRLVVLVAIVD